MAGAAAREASPARTWKPNDVDDLIFYCMLGVILGGRIGYVLFYGMSFWARGPVVSAQDLGGGMSFHGGLLGVIIALVIFARAPQARASRDVFDFTAPLPGIGIFAGRIGNFINGELWGKPTDVPWGFIVERRSAPRLAALRGRASKGCVLFVIIWWFTVEAAAAAGADRVCSWCCIRLVRFLVEFGACRMSTSATWRAAGSPWASCCRCP